MTGYIQLNAATASKRAVVLNKDGTETIDGGPKNNLKNENDRKIVFDWLKITFIGLCHLGFIYGLYLLITAPKLYIIIYSNYILYHQMKHI